MASRGYSKGNLSRYIFPTIIFFCSIGLFFYLLFAGVSSNLDKFVKVVIPGSIDLYLEEPGAYTVFHEYISEIDGVAHRYQGSPTFSCILASLETDETIQSRLPGGDYTYSINQRKAKGYLSFDVVTPGDYTLSCDYGGQGGQETVITISLGFWSALLRAFAKAFFVLAAGIGIAIYMVFSTSRAKE